MKTVAEKLEIKYHQTIGQGTITTAGHSTLAEAAVVLPPQHFTGPLGEVIGEHIDHVLHEPAEHVLGHAKAGHLGGSFAHIKHDTKREKGEGERKDEGVPSEYSHTSEGHPHELRGDHAKHNPEHHMHKGKSHKHPHK